MTEQNKIQLPKNWEWVKLEESVQILDNKRRPINSREREKRISEKDEFALFPYYGATGKVGFIDDYLVEGEFVLLGEDGAPFLDSFKEKAYIISGKSWVNNHAHILKSKTSNRYLKHYLNHFNFNGYVTGTTRLKLNQSSMKNIPIPLPPLPEQHRIVAKIEELFSEINKAVENLQTARQQLKTYRQSVLKHAFLQPQFKYFQVTLKDISSKIQIGPFGSQLHKSDYISDGIPLINPMHIKDFEIFEDYKYSISKEKQESLPNYILRENDIIMGRRGEMGRVALVRKREENWFCGTGSLYIRPNQNQISAKYLMYYLGSQIVKHFLDKNAAGTTMTNLNKEIVMNIPVLVCPIEEQHQIVAEIEKRFSEADKLEESIETALRQTEALRQSILKKAFEGKLVGHDENKTGE